MKRNFSAITLQKNILLMREKTVKVTNISTNDEVTSQSRSLQEFPRRINILKDSFERNKKDLLKPILSNVSDLSDYETYYNNFKPSKINAKESINFNNDEDEIYISKEDFPFNKYQIGICYRRDIHNLNQVFHTPLFMDDSFKGMELDKKYSLEELGIEPEK